MKELLQHIKQLLADNECVIIPDFGGFITHYVPARKMSDSHSFLPPYRTVGFNPRLKINDGLLVQSYMLAHEVSYPVAMQMLEDAIDELRKELNENGYVSIAGLGELSLGIDNILEFNPDENGISSPALYGWSVFEMKELEELRHLHNTTSEKAKEKRNTLVININRTWLNNIVATAAAVILFFFLSTPVENTYVEPERYASLGNAGWFEQIRTQSLATTVISAVPQSQEKKKQMAQSDKHNAIKEEKIVLVKTTEKKNPVASQKSSDAIQGKQRTAVAKNETAPQPIAEVKKKQKQYHIIIASVRNRSDAAKAIKDFDTKGFPGASVVDVDNKVRISLKSSTDKGALEKEIIQLRKNDLFKNAWILTTRN